MRTIDIDDAEHDLTTLLEDLERTGESATLMRQGKAVAELVLKRTRLQPHPLMKKIDVSYDPTEPLTEAEWPNMRG